ncbi:MAG: phosphoribosylamine--glycine ligase [Nitrospirae bacterium RBG_13_39_12]|nr:MAG: phosphoribosylamine--glycine ligase [Nitrospirae bacterium RBG_13_39_12]
MKVLVIGSGEKEHAIVWKLSQSRNINRIFCSPGNTEIAEIAECVDVSPNNFRALIDFVKYEWIDLTVVGPEELFSKGIVDEFEKEGCKILGPNRRAAQLTSSRVFAKNLMRLHRIPTAEFKVFTSYLHAKDYVRLKGTPIVIKADTPFEEPGEFVVSTLEEAMDALKLVIEDRIGVDTSKRVIIEDNLKGERVSFIILTDGKTIVPFTGLHKYKQLFSGNTVPKTTVMGASSPAPIITKKLEDIIMEKIMRPIIKALNSENIIYKGVLSADLVIDKDNPYVFDFKCCFCDPETQTVLPRIKTDFIDLAQAIIEERLSEIKIEWKQGASVCVVISSKDYPNKYQKGAIIKGLEKIKLMNDTVVFHAGTSFLDKDIIASGGRVISIIATGTEIKDASNKAYNALEKISFDGMYYRKDIGNNKF